MADGGLAGPTEPTSFGNGRYVVRGRLGAGNFATVFLADDERLDVPVALKLLSDRWSWDPEVRGRFVQEARLLRSINDPRVIQIRDIAETDDGRPYLVMDLANRGTLDQRLTELAAAGRRLDGGQLLEAAREITAALSVLHRRRIAHRDIKPSNLLITTDDGKATADPAPLSGLLRPGERLVLGDLGLAKNLAFDSGITVGVGTAGYMAPEQSGPGGRIDTRTDIYAASALLAQIASGEAPDPARRVSNGTVEAGRPLPSSIPAPVSAVLAKGLDVEADARQQTIEEWLDELEPALLEAAPPTSAERRDSGADRRARRPALVGAAALVVAAVALLIVFTNRRDDSSGSVTSTTATATTAAPGTTVTVAVTTAEATTSSAVISNAPTGELTVRLSGPSELVTGTQGVWQVDAPNATGGRWALTGPVQVAAGRDGWSPGNWFEGTWNVPCTCDLTLTVYDASGQTASTTFTFTVVDPPAS